MSISPYYFSTVNLQSGVVLGGSSVVVYLTGTTTRANVYNSTGGSISNPMTSDANGVIQFWMTDGAFYDVVWSNGSYVSETFTIGRNTGSRIIASSPVTIKVGFPGAVDTPTSTNCATVQQAFTNICVNYDHAGFTPQIQCAGPTTAGGGGSVQTYYGGLIASFADLDTAATPALVGTYEIILDLGGSVLDGASSAGVGSGYCVVVRGPHLYVLCQNGTFQQSAGLASILYAFNNGSHIGIGPGFTFGSFGSGSLAFVCQATRAGAIRTRPGSTRITLNMGSSTAGALFAAIIGSGSIELEGIEIYNASSTTTFSTGVFLISDNSHISLSQVAWTGNNPNGPQAQIAYGGVFRTNDLQGGQTITIPADLAYGTSSSTVTTNTNPVAGSNYLPGTSPINVVGRSADIDFWPDMPLATNAGTSFTAGSFTVGHSYTITSIGTTNFVAIGAASNTVGLVFVATGAGSGTGTARDYVIQGAEPSFLFGIGSGAVSPITIPLATLTNWRTVCMNCRNNNALTNLDCAFVGPIGTTPGYVVLSWTGGAYAGPALGIYMDIFLSHGDPR